MLGREEFNLEIHSRSFAFIPADREKLDVPKNPFIHFLSPCAAVSSGGAGFCWIPSSYLAWPSSPPTSPPRFNFTALSVDADWR